MELPTPEDLRENRHELELTQSELADMAEVSQPLIARIEGGDVDPRLSTLRRIVTALNEAGGALRRAEDIMHSPVIGVAPDDNVGDSIDRMSREGYSQLPVIRDGYPVGIISNSDIRRMNEDASPAELPIADVMRESITTVTPDATLSEVDTHLNHHDAIIVIDSGEMVGIITEADVATHIS